VYAGVMPRAPFVRGNAASEGGADFIEPHRESIAERVWNLMCANADGLTCAETEGTLKALHQTVSPRFNELTEAGCLRPSGNYRGAPPSEVYVVVPGASFDLYRAWVRAKKSDKKRTAKELDFLAAGRAWVTSDGEEYEYEARMAVLDAAWAAFGPQDKPPPYRREPAPDA
jgi:hypothetical protein